MPSTSSPSASTPNADAVASLRERWSALQEPPPPSREPPPPALTAASGRTSVAVRPLTSTSLPDDVVKPSPPLPKPRRTKAATSATPAQPTLLVPLYVAAGAALVIGALLGLLQTIAWVLGVFEIAVGVVVGLALTPLRRHPTCTRSTFDAATIAFVGVTYLAYLAAACFFADVNPLQFFEGTTFGRYVSMSRGEGLGLGVGLALFFAKMAVSWYAARRTLRALADETLDRF